MKDDERFGALTRFVVVRELATRVNRIEVI